MKMNIIYMASGFSRRFGSNKLLYKYKGKPLYLYGLEKMDELSNMLAEIGLDVEIIVVSSYKEILDKAKELEITGILNENSKFGISSSIYLGTKYSYADYYLYMPADMPFVNPDRVFLLCKEMLINKTCSLFALSNSDNIACSPCIFEAGYREELLSLEGDKGGKKVFCKYPQNAFLLKAPEIELKDIDSIEDLESDVL